MDIMTNDASTHRGRTQGGGRPMFHEPSLLRLGFEDRTLEAAYAADHARRSVLPVRFMAAVLFVVSVSVAAAVLQASTAARLGLDASVSEEAFFWPRSVASAIALAVLVVGVDHPWVQARQQPFIAFCLLFLLLADVPTVARLDLTYGLTANLVQVISAYVLVRLRLRWAAVVGITTSLAYLGTLVAGPVGLVDPVLHVNAGVLVMTHVILAAASHQVERLDRLAFLRQHALERALRELEDAQAQLVETERQASMGRLAAGLLHELNSPLGVVRSASQTLTRMVSRFAQSEDRKVDPGPLLAAQTQAVERLGAAVTRLERFVALDGADERVVDLRDGLLDALALVDSRLAGVDVKVELPDTPVAVRCNPAGLNNAFHAVIDNAARALAGQGHLAVGAERRGQRWQIDVADDGPGVPEDQRPQLFEPTFGREGSRVKMQLGLPTARRAAEACGGRLDYYPRSDGGAVFRFDLPADAGDSEIRDL